MSLQTHINELSRRHRAIEKEIETIRFAPGTETWQLTELKRRKLLLKDEITKLRH